MRLCWTKGGGMLGLYLEFSHVIIFDLNCKELLIAKTSKSLMNKVSIIECEEAIRKVHVKRCQSYKEVYTSSDSSDEELNNPVIKFSQDLPIDGVADFQEKDFVVVLYEGEYFPGQVTEVKTEDNYCLYKIQCMSKSGANWKWPDIPDEMFYQRSEILRKIDPTLVTPVSSRGVFKVNEPVLEAAWLQFQDRLSKQELQPFICLKTCQIVLLIL